MARAQRVAVHFASGPGAGQLESTRHGRSLEARSEASEWLGGNRRGSVD
jgi:hypothetical protein